MGVLPGICITVSSVGAGAFGSAILLVIYASMPTVKVIAADVAHAVPLPLIAGLGYLASGYVDIPPAAEPSGRLVAGDSSGNPCQQQCPGTGAAEPAGRPADAAGPQLHSAVISLHTQCGPKRLDQHFNPQH